MKGQKKIKSLEALEVHLN